MDLLLTFGIALALALAFMNSLNDASHSIATVVATRAISPAKAVFITAICNMLGPFVFTTAVAATIGTAIIAGPAVVTVNIMQLVPLAGPFVGGVVAGLIAGKDFLNGAKAEFVAGFLGVVGVAVDLMADTAFFKVAVPGHPRSPGSCSWLLPVSTFPSLLFLAGPWEGRSGTRHHISYFSPDSA